MDLHHASGSTSIQTWIEVDLLVLLFWKMDLYFWYLSSCFAKVELFLVSELNLCLSLFGGMGGTFAQMGARRKLG